MLRSTKILGVLLDIVVDQTGDMGVAYERSCDFLKERHSHDRWQVTFARPGCVLKVRAFDPAKSYRLNARNASILAPGVEHEAEGVSSIYDTFTLYPSVKLLNRIAKNLGVSTKQLGSGALITRSSWLNELADRYFLRRILEKAATSPELSFLEEEICKEVLVCASGSPRASTTRLVPESTTPLARILDSVESTLFQEFDLTNLARQVRLSPSSLLRVFRKELKTTPYAYVRKRRLEEARALLKQTDKSIGEIAVLVGFTNQGAFTDAFRAIYGTPPSRLRKKS